MAEVEEIRQKRKKRHEKTKTRAISGCGESGI
jgi:hypothetical protein